jgi:hypothetical protein
VCLAEDSDVVFVEPLDMVIPSEASTALITDAEESSKVEKESKNLKAFGVYLGVSYEGFEDELTKFFRAIELKRARWNEKGQTLRRRQPAGNRGCRELRGLFSSINYDVKMNDSCRNSRERAMVVSK